MHPNYRSSLARCALAALPQPDSVESARRPRVRAPRRRRIGRSDALALRANGERHSGSSPQGLTRGPGQLPLIGAFGFSEAPEIVRGFGVSRKRHLVRRSLSAIFRSGPVSNDRLARFHLAAVVIACTAKERGNNHHKLAQSGRAAVKTPCVVGSNPALVPADNWFVGSGDEAGLAPHRGDLVIARARKAWIAARPAP